MRKVIDWMKGVYVRHMKEYYGSKYRYLGMDLEFSVDGEVRVKMIDYIKKIVSKFPETIQGRVATPAAYQLFTVREDTNRNVLDKYWATGFHHSVAQLLFTTTRVSKYIQIAVALIITRARRTNEYDWRKL